MNSAETMETMARAMYTAEPYINPQTDQPYSFDEMLEKDGDHASLAQRYRNMAAAAFNTLPK